MKRAAFLIFISLFIFCIISKAQKTSVSCPYIRISSSVDESSLDQFTRMTMVEDVVCPGTVTILTANITGLDSKIKPTFKWKVTGGKILSEQGTSTIRVQNRLEDVQATVELTGLPKEFKSCPIRVSKVIRVAICDPPTPPCPMAKIIAPDLLVSSDKIFTATAEINSLAFEISYKWTITDGVILEGQGTKTVKAKCLGSEKCIIGFDIKGIPPECPFEIRHIIDVGEHKSPRKVDSYIGLSFDEEKQRLDSFAVELKRKEGAQGYIVVYCKSEEITEDNIKRIDRAKYYLVNDLKFAPDKVTVIYGGYKEYPVTELWITPPGIKPPVQHSK